jgi:hypothetical protein
MLENEQDRFRTIINEYSEPSLPRMLYAALETGATPFHVELFFAHGYLKNLSTYGIASGEKYNSLPCGRLLTSAKPRDWSARTSACGMFALYNVPVGWKDFATPDAPSPIAVLNPLAALKA